MNKKSIPHLALYTGSVQAHKNTAMLLGAFGLRLQFMVEAIS